MYRIVGEQWDPRSHAPRESLSRNGVPFAFYPADSSAGQRLLREFSVDPARLPALIRHDGTVLHNPSFAEVAGTGVFYGAAAVRDECAGVFAAGDVRYGSVKRVAGAVGEGSVTVGSVHQYLADATAEIHPPSSKTGQPG